MIGRINEKNWVYGARNPRSDSRDHRGRGPPTMGPRGRQTATLFQGPLEDPFDSRSDGGSEAVPGRWSGKPGGCED